MENKLYIDCPKFTGRNVPITEIAKAIAKMLNMSVLVCNRAS